MEKIFLVRVKAARTFNALEIRHELREFADALVEYHTHTRPEVTVEILASSPARTRQPELLP